MGMLRKINLGPIKKVIYEHFRLKDFRPSSRLYVTSIEVTLIFHIKWRFCYYDNDEKYVLQLSFDYLSFYPYWFLLSRILNYLVCVPTRGLKIPISLHRIVSTFDVYVRLSPWQNLEVGMWHLWLSWCDPLKSLSWELY